MHTMSPAEVSPVSIAGIAAPRWLAADTPAASPAICLSIITDSPTAVLPKLQSLLWKSFEHHSPFRAEEYRLPGVQVADIACVSGSVLLDYRSHPGTFARALHSLASTFGMPHTVLNPVLLRFTAGEALHTTPTSVDIFHKNALLERIPLDRDCANHEVLGTQGRLAFRVKDGAVEVTHAACRHKTCIATGKISAAGTSIVCIPNELRLTLAGTRTGDSAGTPVRDASALPFL